MKKTLREALIDHFLKYRKMTPQDTVKLIFQSEFGGGHLIADENYALCRLVSELADTPRDAAVPTVEYIGGDACRVNLASLPDGLTPQTLTSVFARSAEMFSGTKERFESKLYEVYSLIDEKYAPFSRFDYMKFIENYFTAGGGAVHHSIYYNSAYRPAYRVIHTDYAPYIELLARIDSVIAKNGRTTVKIDGRCGSGKSTLAKLIAAVYRCGVVHTDDFYLPYDVDRESGENTDFDRLNNELYDIISGKRSDYGVFNCQSQTIDRTEVLPKSPVLIIEGSYSLHPKLSISADISVFLTVPEDEQLKRIEKRSPQSLEAFRTRWIPMEEAYYEKFNVIEKCDFVFDTSK